MSDFSFDTSNYVIMQNRNSETYYAIPKDVWKKTLDVVYENIKTNSQTNPVVNTTRLVKNNLTNQFDLSEINDDINYLDLKGVLIEIKTEVSGS